MMLPIPRQASVLCFSHDFNLQQTRSWLLERANCTCLAVHNASQLREIACTGPVDLLVLCQTVTAEECASSAHFVMEHCPGARFLVLFTDAPKCDLATDYVQLNVQAGPQEFLATTARMLPDFNVVVPQLSQYAA